VEFGHGNKWASEGENVFECCFLDFRLTVSADLLVEEIKVT